MDSNDSLIDYITTVRDYLFSGNDRVPKKRLPTKEVNINHFNNTDKTELNITWLGHSSLMININGYKILTDPVFEKSISLLGPTRYNGKTPLDTNLLNNIDVVIISHNHYDHLNKFSIQLLNKKTKKFIVPLYIGNQISNWGVPQEKIVELDWWEQYRFDKKLLIVATPAQHFSGRGLFDRNKTKWISCVIRTDLHRLFFSGDSGYFDGFKKIGERYGPFDITLIECGTYNSLWSKFHMFPEQSVQAHIDLRGKLLQPIHCGTFNMALHPWYEPFTRLTSFAKDRKVKVSTPIVGETVIYDKKNNFYNWWESYM